MTTAAAPAPVLLEVAEGIAEIRFNRPEVLNAVNVALAEAFNRAVHEVAARSDVRVILLTGAGRAFAAGGDLAYLQQSGDRQAAAYGLIDPLHEALERLAALPQPVLACLQGAVAGAGMSVALAADLAIAADDMVMTMAYIKVGAPPDCGGSWALPRLVGLRRALEIALLGDRIDAAEALRLGLVNRVVPKDQLAAQARALAARLAAGAPLATGRIKALLRASFNHTLPEQLKLEGDAFADNATTADFGEALDAFFQKRAPAFTGR